MPGRNRTGPRGEGALTGRGLGPCGSGIGYGRGAGFGRGFSLVNTKPVNLSKEEKKKILEGELKEIEAEKNKTEKALKELEEEE